jgi:hypothetical protein
LYLIDGPFGSKQKSRYDIINIAEQFKKDDQFIIVFDDCHREGEKQTVDELIKAIEKKGIKVYSGIYSGGKDQVLLATGNYRFYTSL